MRYLLLALATLAFAALFVLGSLGFVPVVAGVFGADTPRDLGTQSTSADLQSAVSKAAAAIAKPAPAPAAPRKNGAPPVQGAPVATFTAKELTALANSSLTRDVPASDLQVRVSDDGTVEASGVLRMDVLRENAAFSGDSPGRSKALLEMLKSLPGGNPPFYVKARASVRDDRVSLDVQKVEIGRLSMPTGWIAEYSAAASSFLEERIKRASGLDVKSLSFEDGVARFEGTMPTAKSGN